MAVIDSARDIEKMLSSHTPMASDSEGVKRLSETLYGLGIHDETTLSEVACALGRYEKSAAEEIANVLSRWFRIDGNSQLLNIVNLLSKDEVYEAIGRYKEGMAGAVAWSLVSVYDPKHTEEVVEAARAFSEDEIVEMLGLYGSSAAPVIARTISHAVASSRHTREGIIRATEILSDEAVVKAIGRYHGRSADGISWSLVNAAFDNHDNSDDRDAIIRTAKFLSEDEVVLAISRSVGRYRSGIAEVVSQSIVYTAAFDKLWDIDTLLNITNFFSEDAIVNALERYEGETVIGAILAMGSIIHVRKERDVILKIARVISDEAVIHSLDGYSERNAILMGQSMALAAAILQDPELTVRYMGLLRTAGAFGMAGKIDVDSGTTIVKLGLDSIIKDGESLETCLAYLQSKGRLPLPTIQNMSGYGVVANEHLRTEYGLKRDLDVHHISLLFSEDADLNALVGLINKSALTDERGYTVISSLDESANVDARSRMEGLALAITSIVGSRNLQKRGEAQTYVSGIVGKKIVDKAFTAFSQDHRELKSKIIAAVKSNDTELAADILRGTHNEFITDVINAMEHNEPTGSLAVKPYRITANASTNPLDFDSRVLLACVYLPNGERINDGIMEYCRDPNIVHVSYSLGGRACASAICYLERTVFLVDSVEGSQRIRDPVFFDVVRRDLQERARVYGADTVLFSHAPENRTPREFLKFLKRTGVEDSAAIMSLDTKAYLEAERGLVRGYRVRV